jgi:hypothetical protein
MMRKSDGRLPFLSAHLCGKWRGLNIRLKWFAQRKGALLSYNLCVFKAANKQYVTAVWS